MNALSALEFVPPVHLISKLTASPTLVLCMAVSGKTAGTVHPPRHLLNLLPKEAQLPNLGALLWERQFLQLQI